MLLAILYGPKEEIVAAAMACDQQPLGDRFWTDVLAVDLPDDYQTGYAKVDDVELANHLLELHLTLDDGHEAAAAIDQSLNRRAPIPVGNGPRNFELQVKRSISETSSAEAVARLVVRLVSLLPRRLVACPQRQLTGVRRGDRRSPRGQAFAAGTMSPRRFLMPWNRQFSLPLG